MKQAEVSITTIPNKKKAWAKQELV